MKKYRNRIYLSISTGVFLGILCVLIFLGQPDLLDTIRQDQSPWKSFVAALEENPGQPLAILLAQVIAIIAVVRLFSWICRKIGQPVVIGEIAAGIILGPTLLGLFYPQFFSALFPTTSLGNLGFLSQIGLILFLFVVGMELDLKLLKTQAREVMVISHSSIVIPFVLGTGLAYFIYTTLAPYGVQFLSFGLFMGIAMSITAFPVLARIVQERGMHKTRLGSIVISCAAADDFIAWCILAAVIAIVKSSSFISALYVIVLAIAYVLLMMYMVRPFLSRVGELYISKESPGKPIIAIFLLTLVLSAYATEVIGIHAFFGAFMAGAIMPVDARFRNLFIEKVEDITILLFLPIFFVYSGLRTNISLLDSPYLWQITVLITITAIAGKLMGSTLAARYTGQRWKESFIIGALMNTRGMMALVVLNIGYDLGIISPTIFTMLVIMILFTTMMTGPSLDVINWVFKTKKDRIPHDIRQKSHFKILLSFQAPENGKTLLRLANSLVKKLGDKASVTAMHLMPSNELNQFNLEEYEKESFIPVTDEANRLNQKVITLFKASSAIDNDIAEVANKGDYDLLLISIGQSIFEGSLLGKILGFTTRIINPDRLIGQVTGRESLFDNSPFDEGTRQILAKAKVPVGVFIDKDLHAIDHVFVPVFSEDDAFIITYAQKMINNSGAQVTVLDAAGRIKHHHAIKETIRAIEHTAPHHIQLLDERMVDKTFLETKDIMLISFESWKKLVDANSLWLPDIPSCLILSHRT